jgi:phosphohistidine swiveling domain-containing protein
MVVELVVIGPVVLTARGESFNAKVEERVVLVQRGWEAEFTLVKVQLRIKGS